MDAHPTIAITAGEPAGIGPELCALLAERHAHQPFAARLVILGDHALLAERAQRIGLAPHYGRYDPLAFAPLGRAIEVWHQPLAAPALPGQPDPGLAPERPLNDPDVVSARLGDPQGNTPTGQGADA